MGTDSATLRAQAQLDGAEDPCPQSPPWIRGAPIPCRTTATAERAARAQAMPRGLTRRPVSADPRPVTSPSGRRACAQGLLTLEPPFPWGAKPESVTLSAESTPDRGVPSASGVHTRPRDPPSAESTVRLRTPSAHTYLTGQCGTSPDQCPAVPIQTTLLSSLTPRRGPTEAQSSRPVCRWTVPAGEAGPLAAACRAPTGAATRPRGKEPRLPRSPLGCSGRKRILPQHFRRSTGSPESLPSRKGRNLLSERAKQPPPRGGRHP